MLSNANGLARLAVLIRAGLFGVLIGELFALIHIVDERIVDLLSYSILRCYVQNIADVTLIVATGYLILRGLISQIRQIFQSYRIDIVLIALLGFSATKVDGGFGAIWYTKIAASLTPLAWFFLTAMLIVIFIALVIQSLKIRCFRMNLHGRFFISDNEVITSDQDLLGLVDRARGFAERILNEGSSDSLVFGIDSPWGTGKSSFVNFCIEYWKSECAKKTTVYKFNPLRYESKANLLEKFIDGLLETIQEDTFLPELAPAISTYSRHIRAKEGLSIAGVKINLFFLTQSLEDSYEALQSVLTRSQRKIIVIVDDLDRLPLEQVKDILFTIKVGFPLPNVSYVLCYDTDNIGPENSTSEDIREFLEKFVNVKISLFLDPSALASYVSKNLKVALKDHLHIDPYTKTKIQDAVGALIEICHSSEFHEFQPYIGNIRKIKRLLNTVMLLEIQGVDFKNCDFNKHDLLYLILLYINFPNIFRKIYNAETNGKWGFFSAVSYGEPGYPADDKSATANQARSYRNSIHYSRYLEDLDVDNQKFLLKKLFELPSSSSTHSYHKEVEKLESSSACFNGTRGTQHNLEQYLHLIVRQSKPLKQEQQKFYLNMVDEFSNGKSIQEIFHEDEFSFTSGEESQVRFWRVLVNKSMDVPCNAGAYAITYLAQHIPDYSLLDWDGTKLVGFRDDAAYILAKLLNDFGWHDGSESRRVNTPENIAEIAEWVFGDGRHKDHGVVQTLSNPERGPLGLYDLLLFRLFCSADRGGDIFNLTRAIAFHADANAPTSGLIRDIAVAEMRELSQVVFYIFKKQYIHKGINLFEFIDTVTFKMITGRYSEYALQEIKLKHVSEKEVKATVERLKSKMKSFIIYQLGNRLVESGVGCGLYDIEGKGDANGIAKEISNYLLNVCFNLEKGEANGRHFLDYAIMNFGNRFGFDSNPGSSVDELTKVMNREGLIQYWLKNGDRIRQIASKAEGRQVITANYTFSYRDAAPRVCEVLDALVSQAD